MAFQQDLAAARRAESRVQAMFEAVGYECTPAPDEAYKPWDIWCAKEGQQFGVQVKDDLSWVQTGNVAIQTACNGKPSGLTATQAKWWVICRSNACNTAIFFRVSDLRAFLRTAGGNLGKIYGGDGGRAQMVLVNLSLLQMAVKNEIRPI